jgi:UDPglucose 6-dehydrogenase
VCHLDPRSATDDTGIDQEGIGVTMRVGVVGTGHVGLVTCGSLAALGHQVVGMDADREKIAMLQGGGMPFHEPGLTELIKEQVGAGRLEFTHETAEHFPAADIVFICVSTPPRSTGEANLIAVEHVAREVATHAAGRTLLVEKSTVPAGTATRVRQTLRYAANGNANLLEVASNPEFLREGHAVHDAMEPDRILVGAEADWAFEAMRELYAPMVARGVPLIETDISTAELAKHASNAFLALKISYVNALARVCELAGGDVVAVADVMGADPRIGRAFLDAGMGYGGSCFPKDVQAFEHLVSKLGYDFPLLREIERINEEAMTATFEKVREALWNLEGKRVALLGLAFKPGTDDVRSSPPIALAERLLSEGATVVAFDPFAMDRAKEEAPGISLAPDAYDAAEGAHCLVLATDWPEFLELDLVRIRRSMTYPLVVDGRNLFDPSTMAEAGFTYHPTGRASVGGE